MADLNDGLPLIELLPLLIALMDVGSSFLLDLRHSQQHIVS